MGQPWCHLHCWLCHQSAVVDSGKYKVLQAKMLLQHSRLKRVVQTVQKGINTGEDRASVFRLRLRMYCEMLKKCVHVW